MSFGCKPQLVRWAEVNRLRVQVRIQPTRRQVPQFCIKPVSEPREMAILIQRVGDGSQANLTKVVHAIGAPGRFLRLAESRKQQTGEYCNNRDHHEQLDQRERAKDVLSAVAAAVKNLILHTNGRFSFWNLGQPFREFKFADPQSNKLNKLRSHGANEEPLNSLST